MAPTHSRMLPTQSDIRSEGKASVANSSVSSKTISENSSILVPLDSIGQASTNGASRHFCRKGIRKQQLTSTKTQSFYQVACAIHKVWGNLQVDKASSQATRDSFGARRGA